MKQLFTKLFGKTNNPSGVAFVSILTLACLSLGWAVENLFRYLTIGHPIAKIILGLACVIALCGFFIGSFAKDVAKDGFTRSKK